MQLVLCTAPAAFRSGGTRRCRYDPHEPSLGEHFGRINAASVKRVHALIERGKAKGKIVLEGF